MCVSTIPLKHAVVLLFLQMTSVDITKLPRFLYVFSFFSLVALFSFRVSTLDFPFTKPYLLRTVLGEVK